MQTQCLHRLHGFCPAPSHVSIAQAVTVSPSLRHASGFRSFLLHSMKATLALLSSALARCFEMDISTAEVGGGVSSSDAIPIDWSWHPLYLHLPPLMLSTHYDLVTDLVLEEGVHRDCCISMQMVNCLALESMHFLHSYRQLTLLDCWIAGNCSIRSENCFQQLTG